MLGALKFAAGGLNLKSKETIGGSSNYVKIDLWNPVMGGWLSKNCSKKDSSGPKSCHVLGDWQPQAYQHQRIAVKVKLVIGKSIGVLPQFSNYIKSTKKELFYV